MIKRFLTIIICVAMLCSGCKNAEKKEQEATKYSEDIYAMDTYMSLTAYGDQAQSAVEEAIEEIKRLDNLWSVGNINSEIYKLNDTGSFNVSKDTMDILDRAKDIYDNTNGAFDITIFPLMNLWGFTNGEYKVPTSKEINDTLELVNQSRLNLCNDKLTLGDKQQIDLGAIAKGYASSRVMDIWKEKGVASGMVTLGGNVQVLGYKNEGTEWRIGIQDPNNQEGELLGVVSIADKAVITSGGYERYFEMDGAKYHHIIDTNTGYPANNGLISVSIISSDGTMADALSTALFVMGKDQAIEYWQNRSMEFDAILVTENGKIYVTEGLKDSFTSDNAFEIVEN